MKKNVLVLALFCCLSMMAQAQVVKYCMNYTDFVAGKWTPLETLTEGRTKQACQLKTANNQVRFCTGDKETDKFLKKEVFAVNYGDQIFVNCRNLRCNDIPLDVSGYSKAFRYGKDKLCVLAYKTNDTALLASLGLDVASFFVDTPVRIGMMVGSTAISACMDYLSCYNCYLIDTEANDKGKYPITRMNDKFMEELLTNDTALLEKYQAGGKKKNRQSAANVIPILMEKGLVAQNCVN